MSAATRSSGTFGCPGTAQPVRRRSVLAGLAAGLVLCSVPAFAHENIGPVKPPRGVPDIEIVASDGFRGPLRERLLGRVTAIQHGNAIFSIMVSFHAEEEGAFDHQDKMPDVPPPEKLTAEEVAKQPIFKEMPDFIRRYYESDRPIELRPVELGRYFGEKIDDGVFKRLTARMSYLSGDFGDPATYRRVGEAIGDAEGTWVCHIGSVRFSLRPARGRC